jgi:hypothetical protein
VRFATYVEQPGGATARAGVVSDAGIHPLPADVTVLDLVRSGLPAALAAGERALGQPAVPLDAVRLLPPLAAPTVRDFVAFEEHVEGVAASVGRPEDPPWCPSGTRRRRSTSPTRTR